jgi:hypothetical protein
MGTREAQLRSKITSDFGDLFEEKSKGLFPKIFSGKSGEKNILFPESDINATKYITLVEGVGGITIEETVDSENNVLRYTYRFLSGDYMYSTTRISNYETKENEIFSFHYDFYKNNHPHEPHLSVCYPTIRYISKKITIDEFLLFIRDTFFDYGADGKLKAKKDSVWSNRI